MISVSEIKDIILNNFNDYVKISEFKRLLWGEYYPFIFYTCKTCGVSYTDFNGSFDSSEKNRIVHHIIRKHKGLFISDLIKPWEDDNSLFCSPKLKEIIGKEPLTSDECRTNKGGKENV